MILKLKRLREKLAEIKYTKCYCSFEAGDVVSYQT